MKTRRRFSAEFKARVALEAIRQETSIAELAARHGLHPNLISQWRRRAISRLPMVFGDRATQISDRQEKRTGAWRKGYATTKSNER